MDDARSILLLLCSEYLCDTSILGISEAAVNRARYTSQHTGHFRRWTHVHVYTGAPVPRDSVITAILMDGRRRPRIRNTASVSFVFV